MDSLSIPMKSVVGVVIALIVVLAIIVGALVSYQHNIYVPTTTITQHKEQSQPRIISLAPSDTQTLISLGLGKYIVGVDTYSYQLLKELNMTNELPENVTVFSQIYPPNISGLLLLHPSVVIVEYGLEAPYISEMQKAGLNVLITNSDYAYSFSQIEQNIMNIATYFNETTSGQELV
ncbi:MAG: ABC transporter substrate-binding protein, partial [Sulfolobus sp.]|nr:ABC transporter substrate-binding protein [Sulfolobus sp.]